MCTNPFSFFQLFLLSRLLSCEVHTLEVSAQPLPLLHSLELSPIYWNIHWNSGRRRLQERGDLQNKVRKCHPVPAPAPGSPPLGSFPGVRWPITRYLSVIVHIESVFSLVIRTNLRMSSTSSGLPCFFLVLHYLIEVQLMSNIV